MICFYTTAGCHLCDKARAVIALALKTPGIGELDLELRVVDIAEDEALFTLYAEQIPVIQLRGVDEALVWPFSHEDISNYIFNHRSKIQGDS